MKRMQNRLKRTIILILLAACIGTAYGQVTVGSNKEPDDFSILEIVSNDAGGLRLPQLSANRLKDITDSEAFKTEKELLARGLVIFNTTSKCIEYWNASRWVSLCEGNSLMTISPDPCLNVNADGTGCDSEFKITDPDCQNGPFTIFIVAGADYANLTGVIEADGIFRVAFRPNNSIYMRAVVVRVTSSCTGLYKDFLFTQVGQACDSSLGNAPAITAVPTNQKFCAGGAVYLSFDASTLGGSATLADVIWTRNNVEVARGKNNIVVTQEGKYEVWMGYVGCNAGAGNSVTITRDGTGAPMPLRILVNGNNGMVCGPTGTTELVALNPNSGGTVVWFKNGIQTNPISVTAVPGGVKAVVGIGDWFAAVQDGTCYSRPSETVFVVENPNSGGSLTVPVVDKSGSFCADGSILLSVSAATYNAAYTYTWYENNTQIGAGSSVMYTVPSGVPSVVIRCRATQAGNCPKEALTVEPITAGSIPAKPAIQGVPLLCSGTATLNIIPAASGTYTWQWYKNNMLIGTTQQIIVTSGGDYYATVTNGCTSPMAHINIPNESSAAPKVDFESSALTPGQANTGDVITYRATITFGPALSYVWSVGNATIQEGGGPNDNYAVVKYGSPGMPAFVQVVVTNVCGTATGLRHVENVGTGCEEVTAGTLRPSTDQSVGVIAGTDFTLGAVSVSFGSAQTAYQWYRNTSKDTSGATEVIDAKSNTLLTSEAATGTYYYFCVMTNKNNCGATPVSSPFYTVTVTTNPASLELGSGSFRGKTCFDIVQGNFDQTCGTEAYRRAQRTDFTIRVEQDNSTPPFTGIQVYTFTPLGNVSNVRFVYKDASGQVIESITPKADYTGDISTGQACKVVVAYKASLQTYLRNVKRTDAYKVELYVIYNDQPGSGGDDKYLDMTVELQDCACCGGFVAPGVWKHFMCYNLGADESADSFTPSKKLVGNYYQWGRKTPAGNTEVIIGTWNTTAAPSGSWVNGSKGKDDPCPAGFRVPSWDEWNGLSYPGYNNWLAVGPWNTTNPNFDSGNVINGGLYLPAAGYRNGLKGGERMLETTGWYWSAKEMDGSDRGYFTALWKGAYNMAGSSFKVDAMTIRCIEEDR